MGSRRGTASISASACASRSPAIRSGSSIGLPGGRIAELSGTTLLLPHRGMRSAGATSSDQPANASAFAPSPPDLSGDAIRTQTLDLSSLRAAPSRPARPNRHDSVATRIVVRFGDTAAAAVAASLLALLALAPAGRRCLYSPAAFAAALMLLAAFESYAAQAFQDRLGSFPPFADWRWFFWAQT
ncbi:MAG: hypothetical protein R3F11_08870 [Verrucomicrobiales bacterium]